MKKISVLLLTVLFVLNSVRPVRAADDAVIRYIMETMSLEEKIGQLFIVRPDCLDPEYIDDDRNPDYKVFTELTGGMKETYKDYPAGGFVLFGKNIVDEEQLVSFNVELHSLNKLTPLICIDEEGGAVSRIANNENFDVPRYTCMEDVGNIDQWGHTYDVGYSIGDYLRRYGFDLDFAPVADVNTNPDNIVIGERAFGSDPYKASYMVQAFICGMHDTGIMTCIKHYPGHGDTSGDSHFDLTYTNKTWQEMQDWELVTFVGGILVDTDMIMVAHIAAPNVTGSDEIATFSYELVTEKLRNELGYNGVIITDSMEMGVIIDNYDPAQAALNAIKAGVDIILLPQIYKEAFDGIKTAILSGEISEERIDESVYRILSMKFRHFGLSYDIFLPMLDIFGRRRTADSLL